ncbi:FOG: CheY-like receiver [Butyrivibrio fibrisolvens 16/4]|nr:FOG: CheY-like receiver [Butyrivibrio fibrisolvens 16/4]
MKSLNIIKNMLKETKMFVGTATTGEECLEKIKFGSYNLVLMDCHMPDITASELLIRVRDIVPDIPVYAISSIPMDEEEFYQSKGFNGVLLKPVDSKLLEKQF